MSTPKPKLSREVIARAALAIADKEGFEAVSMRRVAEDLGVGTMSLYYYVKTKGDLVAVMDDALMAEALLDKLPKDWRKAMLAIANRTHAVFVRHPWALVSMLSAPPGVNAMRHFEQCFEALAGTELSPKEKVTLLANVDDFVFGYALRESAMGANIDLEFAAAQLKSGAFPRLAEVYSAGLVAAKADRFANGLTALLDSSVAQRSGGAFGRGRNRRKKKASERVS